MRRIIILLTILAFLCFTVACQQGEEAASEVKADVEADIQSIKDIVTELEAAMNIGDCDRYLQFYADNAIEIYPNESAYHGKEAIRSRGQKMFDEMTLQDVYKVQDVRVSNDLAVAYLIWSTTVRVNASGNTDKTNGNWIMVFEKQPNGVWKVIYSIWSDESLVYP